MIVKFPIIRKTWDEKNSTIVRELDQIDVEIDTSFKAHLKWEEQFGQTLNCDLATYTRRVKAWIDKPELAKANYFGLLKLLYCYINSIKLPTFKDFVAWFDVEIADQILEKIKVVLEEVYKTASKN